MVGLDNLMGMSLPEVYEAVAAGQVSLDVFADYINSVIAVGVKVGKQKVAEAA